MAFRALFVHLFFPHHSNNHRPKALHIDSLLFYVLVFSLFNFGLRTLHRTMPDVLGYATDIHVEQLLSATNVKRQEAGLAPLVLNDKLNLAAAQKAQDMFSKNYWAHNSPDGLTPWTFITGAGYKYTTAGENLAKNFSTSTNVVDAWMASTTHRENIIKPAYKEIGFAVVNGVLNGEETTLVVQMFGSSLDTVAVQPGTPKSPVVPVQAASVEEVPAKQVNTERLAAAAEPIKSAFLGVTKTPAINIPTLTRDIVFVFAGVLMGVLLLDAWIVSRRKIVRVAGHNIAHFLFLTAIIIAASSISRGTLL